MSNKAFSRRKFILLTPAVAAATLVACAPPPAAAPAEAATLAPTAVPEPTAVPVPTSASATSAEGAPKGTLTVALAFDLQSLDPIMTYALNNGRWQKNVYGYLVSRDEEMNIVPGGGLATSWEQVDDMHVLFNLRQGVQFHNGEDFNADAVVFSFQRLLDPANKSPQRFNYTAIDYFEKVDNYTVKMVMASMDPVIITKLAGYGAAIVPPKFVQEKGNDYVSSTMCPGTGPYQIMAHKPNDSLTLEAFDGYWGEDKAKIKTVVYRIIPDDATRLAEFLSGGVDVLTLTEPQVDAVKGQSGLQIIPVGVPTVNGLRLDASKAPTDNVKVRAAIARAIDTQTIIDTLLNGNGVPMAVWQSPFSFGFDPDLKAYEYDVEKAKQLLSESGVADPNLIYNVIGDDTQAKEIANVVKVMLEAVGFKVDIVQKERATYYDEYVAGKLDNIVPFGWGGWTLDADNTYYSMLYTKESYNPGFSDPEIDKLLAEQRSMLDQAKRKEIFFKLNKMIYDQCPDVMLYQQKYMWGVNERVKDLPLPADERLWLVSASVTE